MINIRINSKIIEKHRMYIKNSSTKQKISNLMELNYLLYLESKHGSAFKEMHVAFCDCLMEEYNNLEEGDEQNIFVGKPKYLYEFIEKVKKEYEDVHQKIQQDEEYFKRIYEVFGYDSFVASHGVIEKGMAAKEKYSIDNFEENANNFKWGAYAYVFSLKIKVCPYCNRNYITPLYSEEGKMRADLDHFFAKSQYPYLSISLFNLVPSCKYCNSSLKGKEEFTYAGNFHPLDKVEADNLYRITYTPKNLSCFLGDKDFDIELEYNQMNKDWEKIKANNTVFQIREVYQYHKDVVTNLIKKRNIYDEGYIEYLWKSYPRLFTSRREVVDSLVTSYDISQVENAPLGKMLKDLMEEMEFN